MADEPLSSDPHGPPWYLPRPIPPPGPWIERAACRGLGTALFFPEEQSRRPGPSEEAVRVCGGCPVRDDCGEYATENGIRYGVWGAVPESTRLPKRRSGARKKKGQ